MNNFLFLDESGDHGLANVDPSFPVFILCGVLISQNEYKAVAERISKFKYSFWQEKTVIFHSRDIRKCEKEFQILFDLDIKKKFYDGINEILSQAEYKIIASAIEKEKYIKVYGRLTDDVYEIALSFIVERSIFCLDSYQGRNNQLHICIEKRGRREDQKLGEHFQKLMSRGTGFVNADRLRAYKMSITFKDKKENIVGLQLADLVAYPIARYIIDSNRANPAFDVIVSKFYSKEGQRYGLKVFP